MNTTARYFGSVSVALAVACSGETTTSLGTDNESSTGGSTENRQGSVSCSATFMSGGGAPLVDPPRPCLSTYTDCSDGHIYELNCDGLSCRCMVDGWPETAPEAFITPRCPLIDEAAERCGWPIADPPGVSSGTGAIQGLPCEVGIADGTSCVCVDGIFMCPGSGGCNVVGAFVPQASDFPVLRYLADGTFYVTEGSADATLSDVVDGAAAAYYGTWSLAGDVLSVRSWGPGDTSCSDEAGRYTVRFNEACSLTELELLDDPCVERRTLAQAWTVHP